ncbi:hypothetical protein FACS1894216_01860 [Synergistales bacterium]|nr:hypothetical protein FACS1894216_01860 [Synergistales bacterium]
MKRVCLITAACLFGVLVFCGLAHACDGGADFAHLPVPRIVALAVADRDFFAKSTLDGRDWLYDVERIGVGIIGIVLIEPMGIEMTYVFDVAANGMQLLSSASIHGKSERTARMSESIRVSDAVKLARLAVEKETSSLRDGMLQLRYGCCQSTE